MIWKECGDIFLPPTSQIYSCRPVDYLDLSILQKKKNMWLKFHPHVNIIFWQVAKKINKIISQVNLNFWRINISTTDIWQVVGWNMPLYQGWGILCRNGVGRSTDPACYWIVSTRQSISSECRVARKCFDWWILCYYLLW